MKFRSLLIATLIFSMPAMAQKKKKDKDEDAQTVLTRIIPPTVLSTQFDSLSYAFGISMANKMKTEGMDSINSEAFAAAVRDFYSKSGQMSLDASNNAMLNFFAEVKMKQDEVTKIAGEKFLEANKTKDGVTTLPSGLQYKVLKANPAGATPVLTDKVTTHYHGTLIDGTIFDSSVDRGKPSSFPVSGVIRGWVEALQKMKVGEKWELYIPSDLAYGSRAQGRIIKPYSTLIFQVELISIDK